MSLRVVFHPDAAQEVREAQRYYAEVDTELGAAFVSELDATLARARRLPFSGRVWQRSDPGRRVFVVPHPARISRAAMAGLARGRTRSAEPAPGG